MTDANKPERNGTPTGREFARIETLVAEASHDIRNLRHAIDTLVEIQRDQDKSIAELRSSIEQVRTRITTGLAVGTAVISAGAWAIAIAARFFG